MQEPEHIGKVCPDCGTHHRVIEAIPARPLTRRDLGSLQESNPFVFARAIIWWPPDPLADDSDDQVAEEIVLATSNKVLALSLFETGWVVTLEIETDDELAAVLADNVWLKARIGYLEDLKDVLDTL